jgi:hypothetical protein
MVSFLFEEDMRTRRLAIALALAGVSAPAGAQWLDYPTPGTPLKKDGTVDRTAKAPRAFNGKPDLSGVWRIEPPKPGEIERLCHPSEVNAVAGDDWRDFDRHFMNLFIDFKEGESPLRPEAIAQQRIRQGGAADFTVFPLFAAWLSDALFSLSPVQDIPGSTRDRHVLRSRWRLSPDSHRWAQAF